MGAQTGTLKKHTLLQFTYRKHVMPLLWDQNFGPNLLLSTRKTTCLVKK